MAEANLYTYAIFLLRNFCCDVFAKSIFAASLLREANLRAVILRDDFHFFAYITIFFALRTLCREALHRA